MNNPVKLPGRSYGLKLFVVCALVLLMSIPAMFISYISFERSSRANDVSTEVSQRYGGAQTIVGPFISVPYASTGRTGVVTETGDYVFFPEDGAADFTNVETELKSRSLFKIPVYQASGQLKASFKAETFETEDENLKLDWSGARIMLGISNGRGLKDDVTVMIAGKRLKFEPAYSKAGAAYAPEGIVMSVNAKHYSGHSGRNGIQYLSVPAGDLVKPGRPLDFSASLSIGGAQHLSVFPFAKSTKVSMVSNWASPGFFGQFPPVDREINDDGFTAQWSVPFLARGIPAHGTSHHVLNSGGDAIRVNFVPEFSPYQTVNRALKYSVLFVGLVFITFFLFEMIIGRPVHPAQYILIGLAQSIFYLLLLAFTEHIGFTLGFAIAAVATIGLTALYAGWTFGSKIYAYRAGIVFALTYGLLFSLMRMQDFALMIGALASFFAIAAVMYLTRNMNWYGAKEAVSHSPSGPRPTNTEIRK